MKSLYEIISPALLGKWHDNGNLKSEYEIIDGFRKNSLMKIWNE